MAFFCASKPLLTTLLFFIAGVPIAVAQTRCDGGFFVQDGGCVPCPPGFFRPLSSEECLPCPAGTFSPASRATTAAVCRRCPKNTFSGEGSPNCKPCPSGLASNPASSTCLACGPGTSFTPLDDFERLNPTRCQSCPAGSYSNGTANLKCEDCPEGFGGPRMATSKDMCFLCPPGRVGGNINRCRACTPGSFKPGRLGSCRDCPRGTTSSRGATSCTPCPKGTRNPRFANRCVDCPSGTTTTGEGGILCRAEGEPCPQNTFEDSVGNCQRCDEGAFFNMTAKICQECPPGSASRGRLETLCQVCPPGASPSISRGACVCDDGLVLTQEGTCEKCPPGTFSRRNTLLSSGGIFVGFCGKCPPGTFQDEEGASECKPCPMDSVSFEEGSTKCERCPTGLVPSIGRIVIEGQDNIICVLPTNACPPGFRRVRSVGTLPPDAILTGCDRIPCLEDTPPEEVGKTCAICAPGTAPDERRGRCTSCARDEFSSGFKCEKCPNGLIRDLIDGSKCSCRRFAFGIQDGVCNRCRRGTVSPGSRETCQVCPPGTKSSSATRCMSCRRGSIAPRAGSGRCRECPKGTFSSPAPRGTKCVRL